LTLVLREEVDLLEVDLADVVLAYLDHLEARGDLDLEVATEFLVLIAALLELKSRLMLPREDEAELELEAGEAAEELLARMLENHRYRGAAAYLHERLAGESGHRYRSAPLPPELRRVSLDHAPGGSAAHSGRCSACPHRSTPATWWRRACRWASGSPICAGCSRGGGSRSTRPSPTPTGSRLP
jgi:segregation and condensation protein A